MRHAQLTVLALLAAAATPAAALRLYDPAAGTLPAAQGWSLLASGTAAGSQALDGGLLHLDTTLAGVGAFGFARSAPQPLDTAAGLVLRWQLQVQTEAHSGQNRAGFSVLLQGADQSRALELGFWSDSVWALAHDPADADLYVRAQTAAWNTAATTVYTLTVQNHGFALAAGGTPLFAGTLRDYPTSGLATAIYGQPNVLFFGDNSSRGQARVQLGAVELLPVPEPGALSLWAIGLGLLGWRLRRR